MKYAEDHVKSFIENLLKNYRLELFFVLLSLFGIAFSVGLYLRAKYDQYDKKSEQVQFVQQDHETARVPTPKKNIVDLSGAVEKPDVYEVTAGARLNDVLVLANGLSKDADRDFFARNFNRARILSDQEKIHIPSRQDVQQGLFKEGTFIMTGVAALPASSKSSVAGVSQSTANGSININSASQTELESLVGIGPARAVSIIAGRPYSSIEELISKKIIPQSVYEKIKTMISTN